MRWLTNLLNRRRRQEPTPDPLVVARRERRSAAEAYAQARERGDTREQNRTLKAYRRATTELVRLEMAR